MRVPPHCGRYWSTVESATKAVQSWSSLRAFKVQLKSECVSHDTRDHAAWLRLNAPKTSHMILEWRYACQSAKEAKDGDA
jgi:hypothetical protein